MRKILYTAALMLAALPAMANAAFIVTYPTTKPVPVANPVNNFAAQLGALGIHSFADTGATLALSTGGLIKFEYMAREALFQEVIKAGGLNFTTPVSAGIVNNFAAPVNLGSYFYTKTGFTPKFSSIYNGNPIAGSFGAGDSHFGIGIPDGSKLVNGSFKTDVLYLLFDDNAQPDDNHDDLIIRATFAVPEPSTWAMMILGFGVIGIVMRRRVQQRVSFV